VSFWSGTLPQGVSEAEGWERMVEGTAEVLSEAQARGVVLAVEPEPGMLVDTADAVLELRRRLGDPDALRVTLDIGHLRCNEDDDPPRVVERVGPLLANVQIDDMRRGVHEHLAFGEGEVDFPPVLRALTATGYRGLVAVELPRHSHAAPEQARHSIAFLRAAEAAASSGQDAGRPDDRPEEGPR
jgi:sugar phosphate isomerase/epimerase